MIDPGDVARLLDILGNRNRRRIIELLRQKPCFVTEISETLMLSPKAVIEHLQMMEREEILSWQTDDRRRKYYYLANDILINVTTKRISREITREMERAEEDATNEHLKNSVAMLGRMIRAHDRLIQNLEQINTDIEAKIDDIAHNHKDLFTGERELSIVIALAHDSLTNAQVARVTRIDPDELSGILRQLENRGIVERYRDRYLLRGVHAE